MLIGLSRRVLIFPIHSLALIVTVFSCVARVVSLGNVVITERIDRTRAGEKSVALPCVGVFELEAGKIKVWRDHFDLGTYERGLT